MKSNNIFFHKSWLQIHLRISQTWPNFRLHSLTKIQLQKARFTSVKLKVAAAKSFRSWHNKSRHEMRRKKIHRRIFRPKIHTLNFTEISIVLGINTQINEWKWRNLQRLHKVYTSAGSYSSDKSHLWTRVTSIRSTKQQSVSPFTNSGPMKYKFHSIPESFPNWVREFGGRNLDNAQKFQWFSCVRASLRFRQRLTKMLTPLTR